MFPVDKTPKTTKRKSAIMKVTACEKSLCKNISDICVWWLALPLILFSRLFPFAVKYFSV